MRKQTVPHNTRLSRGRNHKIQNVHVANQHEAVFKVTKIKINAGEKIFLQYNLQYNTASGGFFRKATFQLKWASTWMSLGENTCNLPPSASIKTVKKFSPEKKKWGYSVLCCCRTKWMFSPCKQAWISLWFLLLSLISILKRIYTSLHFIIIIRACITLPGLRIVKFYKLPAGSCLDRWRRA